MKHALYVFIVILFQFNLTQASAACESHPISYGSGQFKVQSFFYPGDSGGTKNLIVIPPTGGTNWFDHSYAQLFCKRGYNVYILDRWSGDDEYSLDLEVHDRIYSSAQKAIEHTLARIKDSDFVGVFGTSVGAIHASIAMGKFSEIDAAFTIVGGAPIASVIATSDQAVLADVREQRLRRFGFKSTDEYAAALDGVISLQPQKLPRLFQGKPIGIVIADKDTTVPTKNQQALKEFWKPQVTYTFAGGHVSAVLRTWLLLRHDIVKFYDDAAGPLPLL